MKYDPFREVVNGGETYEEIAMMLRGHSPVLVGWTDGEQSHHDVLFSLRPYVAGTIQGGIANAPLFVSVMRVGAFAFGGNPGATLTPGYVAEKLGLGSGESSTAIALEELITGVLAALDKK